MCWNNLCSWVPNIERILKVSGEFDWIELKTIYVETLSNAENLNSFFMDLLWTVWKSFIVTDNLVPYEIFLAVLFTSDAPAEMA